MKILYLVDYFYPFVHGGAEISVLEMAKALVKRGQDIHVLTPNYGAVKNETLDGVNIHRYFFAKKLTESSGQLTNVWHFNPLYWLVLGSVILLEVKKHNINVLHCQSVATVIPAVLVGKFLKLPVVLTFRDAQILCNYGLCLTTDQYGKTCDLKTYFTKDFKHYYEQNVSQKNLVSLFVQIFFAIFGRVRCKVLKYFAQSATVKIVSSNSAKKTFEVNGFDKLTFIHNLYNFPKGPATVKNNSDIVLYATKLSSGKGLDLLLRAFKSVLTSLPKLKLNVVGGGDIEKYKHQVKKLNISNLVRFFGRLDNAQVLIMRKESLMEVAPSIYPESFGRTALEALGCGLPVVVSNRGGFTDIVDDGVTGYIVEPTEESLAQAIIQAQSTNKVLRENIRKNHRKLIRKFLIDPVNKHLALYKKLI